MGRITSILVHMGCYFYFILVLIPTNSHATGIEGGGSLTSKQAYAICRGRDPKIVMPDDGFWICSGVALLIDPVGLDISQLSFSMLYDESKWSFDKSQSGFLCDFSINGDCPPEAASLGSFELEQAALFNAGDPLAGSSVNYLSSSAGLLSFVYEFATPLFVNSGQNFYQAVFEASTPFFLTGSSVEYSNEVGDYDFLETGFQCLNELNLEVNCGSSTPIRGVRLHTVLVSEPSLILLFLSVLVAFGFTAREL